MGYFINLNMGKSSINNFEKNIKVLNKIGEKMSEVAVNENKNLTNDFKTDLEKDFSIRVKISIIDQKCF